MVEIVIEGITADGVFSMLRVGQTVSLKDYVVLREIAGVKKNVVPVYSEKVRVKVE